MIKIMWITKDWGKVYVSGNEVGIARRNSDGTIIYE